MTEKIFIISFWTIGYCCTFWDGMILSPISRYLDNKLPRWLKMPLYDCFICACFWYGSAIYWIVWGHSVKEWLLVVIAAMGLNATISKMFIPYYPPPNE